MISNYTCSVQFILAGHLREIIYNFLALKLFGYKIGDMATAHSVQGANYHSLSIFIVDKLLQPLLTASLEGVSDRHSATLAYPTI